MAAAWSWLALLTNGESVPAMPSVCTRLHSFNLFFILAAVWSYFFWSFWSCRHSNANQARSPPHPCSYSPWAQPVFRLHSCGPSGWLRPSRSFNLEPPLRDFPFTSTTVNFDYAARKHKDVHNGVHWSPWLVAQLPTVRWVAEDRAGRKA
jgi:hypothetical protein